MFNKYNRLFFLKKVIKFRKKKIFLKCKKKITSVLFKKKNYIYNGKYYVFRKFNKFSLNRCINFNTYFNKPLAKPNRKKNV